MAMTLPLLWLWLQALLLFLSVVGCVVLARSWPRLTGWHGLENLLPIIDGPKLTEPASSRGLRRLRLASHPSRGRARKKPRHHRTV